MRSQLKIALVGGIYAKSDSYRSHVETTPETTLERGLRLAGNVVETCGHSCPIATAHFDVVHVHHLGWGALRMALDRSAALFVMTVHDAGTMEQSLPVARRAALAYVLPRADAVVALSCREAEFLKTHYPLARDPVVIPNGIDPEIYRFVSPSSRRAHAGWKLLYVGQLIALKRVDLLLEALAKLSSCVQLSLAYHVNLLEEELKTKAAALGLTGRVEFLGPQTAQQLARLYQDADVLVLPSSQEALPSVVAESMFCGTPVIATRVGGVLEQLGGFGVTVPANDAGALAKAIQRVLTDYPTFALQAEAMSQFARRRASIQTMVARHLALYRELTRESLTARARLHSCRMLYRLADYGVDLLCRMNCGNWCPRMPGHRRPTGAISN